MAHYVRMDMGGKHGQVFGRGNQPGRTDLPEDKMQRLILPLPPSVNHCYHRRGKATFKSEEAKAWQESAMWKAKAWWRRGIRKEKTVMNVWVFWNDGRRRDSDNLLKLAQDALTGIVWVDDYYCLPRVIDWQIDKGNGRIEIEIATQLQI